MSKFTASFILSDRLAYFTNMGDSFLFLALFCPGGGIQAESPKPVCKELMIAKESKDLRDESYSFYERERKTERET